MFFQIGALLLLGSLSVCTALPPCVCTRNFKPVCGSDGQTYGNECMLQCAQVSNPQLIMARTGRCDGTSLGPPRDVRQVQDDCTFCTLEYMPFCGTDGTTYPNRCTLRCAPGSVEIAHQGPCRNKREIVRVAELPARCSCPRNIVPVCGSDGNTYVNDCALDCLSQEKPELRLKHVGACESDVQSCSCSDETNPVCGTDGNIYKNPCYLNCAKEKLDTLEILHVGECDSSVKVATHECAGCTLKVRPICGTDGNTYRNPCMLNCVREDDEDLHIDYEGPCDSRLKLPESPACECTPIVKPVCGTDGNTYRNPCLLNCARDNDETLHVAFEGFCENTVNVAEDTENFPCTCTRNHKPVCASNGVTFGNECLMKCAGSHLTVAKEAPCEA